MPFYKIIHVSILAKIMDLSLRNVCFLENLKPAEVSPIFKKNYDLENENYKPASVLSHASKVFERMMYTQIESFMENKFSKLLTGSSGKIPLTKVVLFVSSS